MNTPHAESIQAECWLQSTAPCQMRAATCGCKGTQVACCWLVPVRPVPPGCRCCCLPDWEMSVMPVSDPLQRTVCDTLIPFVISLEWSGGNRSDENTMGPTSCICRTVGSVIKRRKSARHRNMRHDRRNSQCQCAIPPGVWLANWRLWTQQQIGYCTHCPQTVPDMLLPCPTRLFTLYVCSFVHSPSWKAAAALCSCEQGCVFIPLLQQQRSVVIHHLMAEQLPGCPPLVLLQHSDTAAARFSRFVDPLLDPVSSC